MHTRARTRASARVRTRTRTPEPVHACALACAHPLTPPTHVLIRTLSPRDQYTTVQNLPDSPTRGGDTIDVPSWSDHPDPDPNPDPSPSPNATPTHTYTANPHIHTFAYHRLLLYPRRPSIQVVRLCGGVVAWFRGGVVVWVCACQHMPTHTHPHTTIIHPHTGSR